MDDKRKTRGTDKKQRKKRFYEETVEIRINLNLEIANWVKDKTNGRPSKFISSLIVKERKQYFGLQGKD